MIQFFKSCFLKTSKTELRLFYSTATIYSSKLIPPTVLILSLLSFPFSFHSYFLSFANFSFLKNACWRTFTLTLIHTKLDFEVDHIKTPYRLWIFFFQFYTLYISGITCFVFLCAFVSYFHEPLILGFLNRQ